MSQERITLVAVGDIILHGECDFMFDKVRDVLRSGDITFGNCDQMYSDKGQPSPIHAGGSDPRIIPVLVNAGLDVISLANNHTLDWGTEALLDTLERMGKTNIKVVGAGKNLAEARRPVILEKKGTRVGFLAYGCVGPDSYAAWEDKPGYAPMHSHTIYEKWDYQPGTPPRIITVANPEHMAAMEEDIRQLKSRVDVAAVYFHWGLHFQPAKIPMYGFQIGHAACDAGADIVLGCHAHILKGIEVYKGKVIFHGQNNFAFGGRREAGVNRIPNKWDVYRGGELLKEFYQFEPEPGTINHPEAKTTLIGRVIIEDGRIKKVSYLPCYIGQDGQPEIVSRRDPRGQEVFSYMEKITRRQNLSTSFTWEGDEVVINV